ncbi:hypothetical protein D3C78_1192640 [compost metagenome]
MCCQSRPSASAGCQLKKAMPCSWLDVHYRRFPEHGRQRPACPKICSVAIARRCKMSLAIGLAHCRSQTAGQDRCGCVLIPQVIRNMRRSRVQTFCKSNAIFWPPMAALNRSLRLKAVSWCWSGWRSKPIRMSLMHWWSTYCPPGLSLKTKTWPAVAPACKTAAVKSRICSARCNRLISSIWSSATIASLRQSR